MNCPEVYWCWHYFYHMEWNGMEFCCLDSRPLCLTENILWLAKEHPWSGAWKYLDRIQAFRHPHARQICQTAQKPKLKGVQQTTLQLLGKFVRLSKAEAHDCPTNYPANVLKFLEAWLFGINTWAPNWKNKSEHCWTRVHPVIILYFFVF